MGFQRLSPLLALPNVTFDPESPRQFGLKPSSKSPRATLAEMQSLGLIIRKTFLEREEDYSEESRKRERSWRVETARYTTKVAASPAASSARSSPMPSLSNAILWSFGGLQRLRSAARPWGPHSEEHVDKSVHDWLQEYKALLAAWHPDRNRGREDCFRSVLDQRSSTMSPNPHLDPYFKHEHFHT